MFAQLDASFKIENSNTSACNKLEVTLLPEQSVCPSDSCDYIWDFDDGEIDTVSSAEAIKHFYNQNGEYSISLSLHDRVTGDTSTTLTKYDVVKIYKPDADFSDVSESLDFGGSYTRAFKQPVDDVYPEAWKSSWEIEGILEYESYYQENFSYQFPEDGEYAVTLTVRLNSEDNYIIGYDECFDTKTKTIKVDDEFFLSGNRENPDIHRLVLITEESRSQYNNSGSSDGVNDFSFKSNGKDILSVKIFNQWGSVVYKRDHITGHFSWFGNALNSGEYVPSGIYYFVIESDAKDEQHNVKGFLQVINNL